MPLLAGWISAFSFRVREPDDLGGPTGGGRKGRDDNSRYGLGRRRKRGGRPARALTTVSVRTHALVATLCRATAVAVGLPVACVGILVMNLPEAVLVVFLSSVVGLGARAFGHTAPLGG